MKLNVFCMALGAVSLLLAACEPNPVVNNGGKIDPTGSTLRGMYVLNEGSYNLNNASLDYLDFQSGIYTTDTFTLANPSLTQGLGDVANDIIVYGSKGYICVNGSGLVEVIDARTARHLAAINIANCRRLCADNGQVYVTSYAGRVEDDNHQLGYVARIDTTTLTITATCEVGYQPEGMAIVNGKLYVANSGGYMGMNTGVYDNRLSVISLSTFTLDKHLTIATNLQDILVDSQSQLWIASYGNYYDINADIIRFNPTTEAFTSQGVPVTKMVMANDTICFYATTYDDTWTPTTSFYKLATSTSSLYPLTLSTPVATPYALGVNPQSGNLYITDAGDYVNPGSLLCFKADGTYQWKLSTGVIPGHFALVY